MAVRVTFFLRGKESAPPEKPCAIYATVEVDDEKCIPFSTKLKIPAKYWMASGGDKIKPSTVEHPVSFSYSLAEEINDYLIAIQKAAYQALEVLHENEIPVTAATVRSELLNPRPKLVVKKFVDVINELIAAQSAKRKPATLLTYRTRNNNIAEFLNEKRLSKLLIHDFRYDHFEAIQIWMIGQLNPDGTRRWCKNNINKHLTLVNKTLNYGVNKGYIRQNPIGELGLEYDETKPPQYLTPKYRQKIQECDLTTLTKERDISVFLYSTGLSYTDYLSLTNHHFHQLESGEWFIKKQRDKSNIFSIIPLLPQAQEIIIKYGGVNTLPRPDISDLNKTLKILGEVCKLPYSISTSTFRDTFCSMMENEYMLKSRTVMFMMGHTNERQLRNYSSVMPARLLHELKKENVVIPFNLEKFNELVQAS